MKRIVAPAVAEERDAPKHDRIFVAELDLDLAARARLEAAFALWLVDHPAYGHCRVELVAALVPLPPARGAVRWIRW